jgi:hypothetical protein
MAKHITSLAYIVFEAALVGIFGYFGQSLVSDLFHVNVSGVFFAVDMLVVNAILTYYDPGLTAKILGVFLVAEVVMLALLAVSVVVNGGGPEGWPGKSAESPVFSARRL